MYTKARSTQTTNHHCQLLSLWQAKIVNHVMYNPSVGIHYVYTTPAICINSALLYSHTIIIDGVFRRHHIILNNVNTNEHRTNPRVGKCVHSPVEMNRQKISARLSCVSVVLHAGMSSSAALVFNGSSRTRETGFFFSSGSASSAAVS